MWKCIIFYSINIQHIDCYCIKKLWCCFPMPSFIYFMMGLFICKYESFWQEYNGVCKQIFKTLLILYTHTVAVMRLHLSKKNNPLLKCFIDIKKSNSLYYSLISKNHFSFYIWNSILSYRTIIFDSKKKFWYQEFKVLNIFLWYQKIYHMFLSKARYNRVIFLNITWKLLINIR